MEFDFIWVEGRETNESYEWFKKVDFVNILSSMFYSFTSISCLSGLPSVTYGLKFFIYFIYFFCFWISNPSAAQRLAVNAKITRENSGTYHVGFVPTLTNDKLPSLVFFAHGRYEKKGFSFNNERRIIWYFREFYLGKLLSGVIYTPPFKM